MMYSLKFQSRLSHFLEFFTLSQLILIICQSKLILINPIFIEKLIISPLLFQCECHFSLFFSHQNLYLFPILTFLNFHLQNILLCLFFRQRDYFTTSVDFLLHQHLHCFYLLIVLLIGICHAFFIVEVHGFVELAVVDASLSQNVFLDFLLL